MANRSTVRESEKTFQSIFCDSPFPLEFQKTNVIFPFITLNICLFTTAIVGNFLILVALNKERSLHLPSKLFFRCLAITYQLLFVHVAVYLNVSLLVYSGLRDPEWQIGPITHKYQEISSDLIQARRDRRVYSYSCIPPKSGYKGFLVQDAAGIQLIVGSETVSLQLALLYTMPSDFYSIRSRFERVIASGFVSKECQARRKRGAPPYNPANWNFNNNIRSLVTQYCNNCYNYATNLLTNNYAQPGFATGKMFARRTNDEVRDAAMRDGLVNLNPQQDDKDEVPQPPAANGEHLVALFVAKGNNY